MQNIVSSIASIWAKGVRDILLVHGAGSYGHPLASKYGLSKGIQNEEGIYGFALTHSSCSELSNLLCNMLLEKRVPAISIPPSSIILQKNRRIVDFSSIPIEYLENGFLPVLYGDSVPDTELLGSVCSGDQIVSYLSKDASLVALGSDVDGVLDENGNVIPEITTKNFSQASKSFKTVPGDVTGGMRGKVEELLSIKASSYLFNFNHPSRLEDLVFGRKTICTKIVPSK
jgi:isopentenyl phosphate kinase